jgi:hypothetical protein
MAQCPDPFEFDRPRTREELTIPAGLGTGDLPITATVAGVRTQTGVVISPQ